MLVAEFVAHKSLKENIINYSKFFGLYKVKLSLFDLIFMNVALYYSAIFTSIQSKLFKTFFKTSKGKE